MNKKEQMQWFSVAIAIGLFIILHMFFPIMECYDGCSMCDYERVWYEVPETPFADRKYFLRIEKPGDSSHKHDLYDETWSVFIKMPWQ